MRLSDLAGLLFGVVMFGLGAWFFRWAVFDGTVTGWFTVPDDFEGAIGPEGWITVPAPSTSRVVAGGFGALLMTPITWITASCLRGRFHSPVRL